MIKLGLLFTDKILESHPISPLATATFVIIVLTKMGEIEHSRKTIRSYKKPPEHKKGVWI